MKEEVVTHKWTRVMWVLLLVMVALAIAFLAIKTVDSRAQGASTKVWLPAVLQPYRLGWDSFCSFEGYNVSAPSFSVLCSPSAIEYGHGYMKFYSYNNNGWFTFDGCLPVGNCAEYRHDPSNVDWTYVKGLLTVSPFIRPGRVLGPGYFSISYTPQGYVSGNGCWPWGDCQVSPFPAEDK